MAKITLSRIFDITKLLSTSAGQQLQDGLTYLSQFAEITLRNLRNGLTYADNFACEIKSVSLQNNVETIVSPSNTKNPVTQVVVRRASDSTYYVVDSFGWKYNPAGQLVVKIIYNNFNPANNGIAYPCELLIYF